jgi:hypothetical protein
VALYLPSYVWGRYLTPPDFSASGNRVVISMEDVNLGKQREKNLSWIQKVERVPYQLALLKIRKPRNFCVVDSVNLY